jgi:hypothetical protein
LNAPIARRNECHDQHTATRRILGLGGRPMTVAERQSLIAGGLGWMLDAMDVMLYSCCSTSALGMGKPQAGLLNSLTCSPPPSAVSAGLLADRIKRTRASWGRS